LDLPEELPVQMEGCSNVHSGFVHESISTMMLESTFCLMDEVKKFRIDVAW
jgi:hypothetical protein